MDNIVLLIVV